MKSIRKHKTSMKQLTKKLAHYERKNTHDCHSWGLPAGANSIKRVLLYKDGYRYSGGGIRSESSFNEGQ